MRVVILQPSYLPWVGYFDQIRRADVFVFYDDVQFDKNGWRNRNRIKTPKGPAWLTVPVRTSGRFGQTICDTMIDNAQPWAMKHLGLLDANYRRAPYFAQTMQVIEPILRRPWELLADLDIELTIALANAIGLSRQFVRSSELGITGGQTERLVRICRRFDATNYLSGAAAKTYLDVTQFAKAEIGVEFHEFQHPGYPQLHGEFVSHLSVVDALMNLGPSCEMVVPEPAVVNANSETA